MTILLSLEQLRACEEKKITVKCNSLINQPGEVFKKKGTKRPHSSRGYHRYLYL